jgi:hypothetical protein
MAPSNVEEAVELVQLVITIAALIIAPGVGTNLYRRIRWRLLVDCRPPHPTVAHRLEKWRLEFVNRSRRHQNVDVFVLPEKQGNSILNVQILTKPDPGLICEPQVAEGRLLLRFPWFLKRRRFTCIVQFANADLPVFESSIGGVRRNVVSGAEAVPFDHPYHSELMIQRAYLLLFGFYAMTILICGKIIYAHLVLN